MVSTDVLGWDHKGGRTIVNVAFLKAVIYYMVRIFRVHEDFTHKYHFHNKKKMHRAKLTKAKSGNIFIFITNIVLILDKKKKRKKIKKHLKYI